MMLWLYFLGVYLGDIEIRHKPCLECDSGGPERVGIVIMKDVWALLCSLGSCVWLEFPIIKSQNINYGSTL